MKLKDACKLLTDPVSRCLRVDFYVADGKIYFGEMTFYTWGGFIAFTPPEWDRKMGDWIQLPAEQNP